MITVTATRTHRRAGRNFERGVPVTLDPEDLSEAESEALLSDPELSIRQSAEPAEKPASAKKPAPSKEPEPAKPAQPEIPAEERAAKVLEAIPDLPNSDLNKDGAPNVKALSKLLGFDVTKAEIDAALAAIVEANAS